MEIKIYIPKEKDSEFYRKLLIISKNEVKYNLKIGFLRYSNIELPEDWGEPLVLIHNCGRAYLLDFEDKSGVELIKAIVEEIILELNDPFNDLENPMFVFLNEGQKIDLTNLEYELENKFELVDVLHRDDIPVEPMERKVEFIEL